MVIKPRHKRIPTIRNSPFILPWNYPCEGLKNSIMQVKFEEVFVIVKERSVINHCPYKPDISRIH
jgi:hypothetical protein